MADLLQDLDPSVRAEAELVLARAGAEELAARLSDRDAGTRERAAAALQTMGGAGAAALAERRTQLRNVQLDTIEGMGHTIIKRYQTSAFQTLSDSFRRFWCPRTVCPHGWPRLDCIRVAGLAEPATRAQAAACLARMRRTGAAALRARLRDADGAVREVAVSTLAAMDQAFDASCAAALAARLVDAAPGVRGCAVDGLGPLAIDMSKTTRRK